MLHKFTKVSLSGSGLAVLPKNRHHRPAAAAPAPAPQLGIYSGRFSDVRLCACFDVKILSVKWITPFWIISQSTDDDTGQPHWHAEAAATRRAGASHSKCYVCSNVMQANASNTVRSKRIRQLSNVCWICSRPPENPPYSLSLYLWQKSTALQCEVLHRLLLCAENIAHV